MKRDDEAAAEGDELADELDAIRDALDHGNSRPLRRFLDASQDFRVGRLAHLSVQEHVPTLEEGATIGDFVIQERIDEGGMGVVYRARRHADGRVVAFKVMKGHYAAGNYAVRRFEAEVQALLRLRHPAIVEVIASGTLHDGRPWLAMEFVDGLRLDRWMLSDHPLASHLELVRHLCEALEHAHARGVVHRDLKPSNVLIDEAGRPHVLDFGLARMLDRVTQDSFSGGPNRLVGTLPWMSPEQVRGKTADERSDIHALGLILYRLITGEMAFDIDSLDWVDAMKAVTESAPRPHARLTGDLEIVITKALRRDPDLRFQRVSELREEIERILAGRSVLSRPPTWFERTWEWVRKNPGTSSSLGITFVSVTAGLVISLIMYSRLTKQQRLSDLRLRMLENVIRLGDPGRSSGSLTPEGMANAGIELVESTDAEALGVDEGDLVETRSYVAGLLVEIGIPGRAIPLLERAARFQEDEGSDDLARAQAYRDLGFAYHANEQFAQADQFKRKALEVRERLLPENDARVIQSRDELADLLRDTFRLDAAVELLERNVEAVARSGTRLQLALALRSLAATLAETGHVPRRYDCLYEADAILDGLPNVDLDTRLEVRADLAFVAVDADSIDRGWQKILSARALCSSSSSQVSDRVLARLELREAFYLQRMHLIDLGELRARKAVEIAERVYGAQHDLAREARSVHAHFVSQLGRCEEAIALLAGSREVIRASRGTNNALWRQATMDLAGELASHGREVEALSTLDTVRESIQGDSIKSQVQEFAYRLMRTDLFRTFSNEPAAMVECERLVELAQSIESTPGLRTARAYQARGIQSIRLGEYERALSDLMLAESITIPLAGESSIPVASLRCSIATALFRLGRVAEAQAYAAVAIALIKHFRGADHPECRSLELDLERERIRAKR